MGTMARRRRSGCKTEFSSRTAQDTADDSAWSGNGLRKPPRLITGDWQPALSGNDTSKFNHSRICPSLARIPSVLFSLGMLSISPAFAGLTDPATQVIGTDPANASHSAPVSTDVSATLDGQAYGDVNGQTYVIHGSQTPITSVSYSLSTTGTFPNDIIIGNPAGDFHPGERSRPRSHPVSACLTM